ncbi:MAG: hypothetical protein R3B96_20810 [Pirellulaceae bacterium]
MLAVCVASSLPSREGALDLPIPRSIVSTRWVEPLVRSSKSRSSAADLEGPATLLIPRPGFSIEPVADQERKFRIHIAPDVPVGTYDVYASGRFGVSNSRRFAVTHRLQTVADAGKDHDRSALSESNSTRSSTG